MKIKKIGHCCLVIEINGIRILTDPGAFTVGLNQNLSDIDLIFISHEHGDHLHTKSLKELLTKNPQAKIITNSGVGKILRAEQITYEILEGRASKNFNGLNVEAYDEKHAEIFEDFGQVQNTGYFFGDELFYPGDAYADPKRQINVLAMPVSGPWSKISDAIYYALKVKPKKAFPVHDGLIKNEHLAIIHKWPQKILASNGIIFEPMTDGDEREF